MLIMKPISYPLQLIPDWEKPASLFLVWPRQLNDYISTPDIMNNFRTLIRAVPSRIPITIVMKNNRGNPAIDKDSAGQDDNGRVTRVTLPGIHDIWLRDFMPIPAIDAAGLKAGVKTLYRPRYLSSKEAKSQHIAGISMCEKIKLPLVDIPLVWDIGNLTHNGNGTALVTRRIISDNPGIRIKALRRQFRDVLGITKLILIDEDPEDATGHIDWLVRFLGPKTVAVAKFPEACPELNRFMDKIKRQLRQGLGTGYKIIDLMNSLLIDEIIDDDEVGNAFGNHMNFLRLGPDVMMLPVYNVATDEMAIKKLRRALPLCKIIPVEASALSMKGGVLNCVSWVKY
jgi:agmatine deiminase